MTESCLSVGLRAFKPRRACFPNGFDAVGPCELRSEVIPRDSFAPELASHVTGPTADCCVVHKTNVYT